MTTTVSPSGNTSSASFVIDYIPTMSSVIILPKFTIYDAICIASIVIGFGTIRTGEVVSTTVIV